VTAAPSKTDAEWTALLADTLDKLQVSLGTARLAYLTATSKVENPVRDGMAYFMHRCLLADGYVVAREYPAGKLQRRDIAILADGKPEVEVELKALYGCNVVSQAGRAEYLSSHAADAARLRLSPAAGFLVSLVTHPMDRIEEPALWAVKYPRQHNAAVKTMGGATELYQKAQRWYDDLAQFGPVPHHTEHDLGSVYGLPLRLSCYLVGPLEKVVPSGVSQPIVRA